MVGTFLLGDGFFCLLLGRQRPLSEQLLLLLSWVASCWVVMMDGTRVELEREDNFVFVWVTRHRELARDDDDANTACWMSVVKCSIIFPFCRLSEQLLFLASSKNAIQVKASTFNQMCERNFLLCSAVCPTGRSKNKTNTTSKQNSKKQDRHNPFFLFFFHVQHTTKQPTSTTNLNQQQQPTNHLNNNNNLNQQ